MFQVNDRVTAFGCEGVVINIDETTYMFPILAEFGDKVMYFLRDGKMHEWHKEPSLKLIARAKTKVKLYPVLIRLSCGQYMKTEELYPDKAEALLQFPDQFIRLLTEFPVEVEE